MTSIITLASITALVHDTHKPSGIFNSVTSSINECYTHLESQASKVSMKADAHDQLQRLESWQALYRQLAKVWKGKCPDPGDETSKAKARLENGKKMLDKIIGNGGAPQLVPSTYDTVHGTCAPLTEKFGAVTETLWKEHEAIGREVAKIARRSAFSLGFV